MPVLASALLTDLRRQVSSLEADLKQQVEKLPDLEGSLREEWQNGRDAGRVGEAFELWFGDQAIQAAVHWVLGCVFVRFLEDNQLIGEALIAGPGERLREAEGREAAYYGEHPLENERDWLLYAFRAVAALPGGNMLFDERHNPIFRWPISPDAAKALVRFWRRQDPGTGALVHDFTDSVWATRFLGDLYQDLSEHAKKKYALLQTPVFVEEFILDRTLGEALRVLPLDRVTVIDPTCGSGHFLLGTFSRLLSAWEQTAPATRREVLAQHALNQIAGVDLNPFAAAIARFRLLIAALRACDVRRLRQAPTFSTHVVVGDALLHGDVQTELTLGDEATRRRMSHTFSDEDLVAVNEVLGRRYAVVVGNPPYITPKDKALNAQYRARYAVCKGKYALSVPFVQRFWELAASDAGGGTAGWIGMINASSFMKREFGVALVEEFLPRVDLTHVINTADAYLPGHNTSTVIMFGRKRPPVAESVRAVLAIKGVTGVPVEPSSAPVWSAILDQVDHPGSRSDYVSVADIERSVLSAHPWSLTGGGASDLRATIERAAARTLRQCAEALGVQSLTGEDDFFATDEASLTRNGVDARHIRPLVSGWQIREWSANKGGVLFPYDAAFHPEYPVGAERLLWPFRARLAGRVYFGETQVERGLAWFEFALVSEERARAPKVIAFAEMATHNHFVRLPAGLVLDQTAPVIVVSGNLDAAVFAGLIGVLNSSVGCFWLKQVCFPKGGDTVGSEGARVRKTLWDERYAFNSTNVAEFPVPSELPGGIGARIESYARQYQQSLPAGWVSRAAPTRRALSEARTRSAELLGKLVALQEELDWQCYAAYGLIKDDLTYRDARGVAVEPPQIALGQRAFEVVLARRVQQGEEEATWFVRHGSAPVTDLPDSWPTDYRALVERRIVAIESDRNVGLIERPEYKRRWNLDTWESRERVALATWLLDRLESPAYWRDLAPQSTRDLASRAALDAEFGAVAALWAGDAGAEMESVIRRLVMEEAVPCLSTIRYSDTGAVKRAMWERTWELQRQEDALDAQVASKLRRLEDESDDAYGRRLAAAQQARREAEMDPIERPPKYTSKDFANTTYWKLRGALDVPKERFILYPFANRAGDDAPLVGWAGWNHLQQAQALAALYVERTQTDGWQGAQVIPLLAGVAELVPWLKQWHNQVDPEYGQRLGDFYATWLEEELRTQGLTRADLANWHPPETGRGRRRRA